MTGIPIVHDTLYCMCKQHILTSVAQHEMFWTINSTAIYALGDPEFFPQQPPRVLKILIFDAICTQVAQMNFGRIYTYLLLYYRGL